MRKTIADRLLARLVKEFSLKLDPDAKLVRVRAGHWQRSAGSWLWILEGGGPHGSALGSQWTMRECLDAEKLTGDGHLGDFHIMPMFSPQQEAVRSIKAKTERMNWNEVRRLAGSSMARKRWIRKTTGSCNAASEKVLVRSLRAKGILTE